MRLSHNLASLNIFREQNKNINSQRISMNRISSGIKISGAKDDPNGLAESERMRMQIRGMQMVQKNAQDGVSMLQAAEGGMDELTSMVQRIRELTVQAGGVTTPDDKVTIQNEISQLTKGIDDIANNTEFNGVKLIGDTTVTNNNTPSNILMAVGANSGETTKIPTFNLTSANLGNTSTGQFLTSIDLSSPSGISNALDTVDNALSMLSNIKTQYGALENRFDTSYSNIDDININLQGAESSVRDTDIAAEMANFAKNGVLIEAGNALMAQTNKFPQQILEILNNVR